MHSHGMEIQVEDTQNITTFMGYVPPRESIRSPSRTFVTVSILAPVVQTVNSAIHRINHYPLHNSIGFASVYLLGSDLSGG